MFYRTFQGEQLSMLGFVIMRLPPEKRPSACIVCGKCSRVCPQQIDIPAALRDLADRCAAHPDWEKYSRRAEKKS